MLDILIQELASDFQDPVHRVRVFVRLAIACALGFALGCERRFEKKQVQIRTHMLVAMGAALFAVIAVAVGESHPHLTPVIQGVATGIGFLGAGIMITRRPQEPGDESVHGLNSAAAIWLTAGTGLAAGAGLLWVALLSTIITIACMLVGNFLAHRAKKSQDSKT
jgi:putative Mg2+ transporter-C (MgtC) family protein